MTQRTNGVHRPQAGGALRANAPHRKVGGLFTHRRKNAKPIYIRAGGDGPRLLAPPPPPSSLLKHGQSIADYRYEAGDVTTPRAAPTLVAAWANKPAHQRAEGLMPYERHHGSLYRMNTRTRNIEHMYDGADELGFLVVTTPEKTLFTIKHGTRAFLEEYRDKKKEVISALWEDSLVSLVTASASEWDLDVLNAAQANPHVLLPIAPALLEDAAGPGDSTCAS